MNYSKNRSIAVFLTISFLLSACNNKKEEASQNGASAAVQVANQGEAARQSGTTKINAFISRNEISKKSFEQGAQLAISSNPTQAFDLAFLDDSQGSPAAPAALYWSVDDISAVAASLDSSETVGIVSGEVNKKVTALGANVYGLGYSTELTFKQLAKFAGNTLKSYRFAVITADDPRFDLQKRVFIEESKSLGNTIVFEEKVTPVNADFKLLIARADTEKCDTVIALLPAPELVNLIKSIRANHYKGKLIVGDSLFAPDISALGQDAEGLYMTQAWSDDANLKSQYISKFGSSPDAISLGFAALGYDTVRCLQGMNSPLDAYSIKSSLLSTPCEGITGMTQFTGERIAQRRKVILTVKDGQIVKGE